MSHNPLPRRPHGRDQIVQSGDDWPIRRGERSYLASSVHWLTDWLGHCIANRKARAGLRIDHITWSVTSAARCWLANQPDDVTRSHVKVTRWVSECPRVHWLSCCVGCGTWQVYLGVTLTLQYCKMSIFRARTYFSRLGKGKKNWWQY